MDRRAAQGGRAGSLTRAHRTASKRQPAHRDMAGREPPSRAAQQVNEMIAGNAAAGCGAGMSRPAAAIDLAGRNAGQADTRAFGAPDRAIAVPDRHRGAGEDSARADYGGENERDHRSRTFIGRSDMKSAGTSSDRTNMQYAAQSAGVEDGAVPS